MAIAITLEDEDGSKRREVLDIHNVIVRLALSDARVVMARGIDPYGDTVFNRLQTPAVIGELMMLAEEASPAEEAVLNEVIELLRHCDDEPHLYVKFYGD
jgi:hypothetical protein